MNTFKRFASYGVFFALALFLTACGGGSDSTAPSTGSVVVNGQTTLIAGLAEPASANCPNGGTRFNLGLDGNANGVLDTAEITSTQYVCNGSNGLPGGIGATGATGASGATGATGATGTATLVNITPEPAGTHCAYAGNRADAGLDSNRDGVLQPGEVTASLYICNPPPAGLTWINVTDTMATAAPNRGYLANSASRVLINLPESSALAVGDIVRINGVGSGGWRIVQNAGQAINTSALGLPIPVSASWTPRETARVWLSVASSSDGNKLVGVVDGGRIYTSVNSGVSWTERATGQRWFSVASSSDGIKLVAVAQDGQIWTSTDSGASWTARETNRSWVSVASSSDGSKLVALTKPFMANGRIYTSTDSGLTWTERLIEAPWTSVASSSDGNKLVAVSNGGQIYTSTDSGVNWTARESARSWVAVASSSDGGKLVAAAGNRQIYTSTDSGLTWIARDTNRGWISVTSSSDGSRLAAVVDGGQIYTSTDSGSSWLAQESNRRWYAIASSSDGSKLVAAGINIQIYTLASGGVVGAAGSTIELQYVGGGAFSILSTVGSLSVQ
jgi:hypothetical protein